MINSNQTCIYWEMCSSQDQRAYAPRPEHTRVISSRSTLQNQMDGKKHGVPHHIYPNPRQTVAIKIVRMRKQRQQAAILPRIYGGWSKQDSEAKDHILIPVWLLKSTKDMSKNSSSPIKMNPRDIQRIQKLMIVAVHDAREWTWPDHTDTNLGAYEYVHARVRSMRKRACVTKHWISSFMRSCTKFGYIIILYQYHY